MLQCAAAAVHSPPTQQHTDHITKLKTFPVSTSWTYGVMQANVGQKVTFLTPP